MLWSGLLTPVLPAVWVMSGAGYLWPIWPILGFATLLGWQAFNVLGRGPMTAAAAAEPASEAVRTMPR